MSPPGGKEPPYAVHWSKAVMQVFRQLHQQASAAGLEGQFLSAAQTVVERLQSDPLSCGEACYNLRNLDLEIRNVIMAPVFVSYGVHKEKHLVFIKEIRLLPGNNPSA